MTSKNDFIRKPHSLLDTAVNATSFEAEWEQLMSGAELELTTQ
jgi:hypothetical protein